MIKAQNLIRTSGRNRIVDAVSLALGAGEIGGLLGPSGSGKSSLLRLIMGLDTPDSGRVMLDGRIVSGPGVHVAPEQRGISMLFQDFTLFPHLSVQQNLEFGRQRKEVDIDAIVEMLEIGRLSRRSIGNLSGGEQQRVAIARALASGPRLLLLDEPFSNIDNMLKDRLYDRIRDYLRRSGITAIVATHDHDEAFFFSDWMFVMRAGRLIDTNTPEGIYHAPANRWVAEFFGAANVLTEAHLAQLGRNVPEGQYLVRPEMLELRVADQSGAGLTASVDRATFFGFYRDLKVTTGQGQELKLRDQGCKAPKVGDTVQVRLRDGAEPHRLGLEASPA